MGANAGIVIVILASTCGLLCAYPWGAGWQSCHHMVPLHGADPIEDREPPYELLVPTHYTAGQSVSVTLRATDSGHFKGFLVQARMIQGDAVVGFFSLGDDHRESCPFSQAVTHKNNTEKRQVGFTWFAPLHLLDEIYFRATVVEEFGIIWLGVMSRTVAEAGQPEPITDGVSLMPTTSTTMPTASTTTSTPSTTMPTTSTTTTSTTRTTTTPTTSTTSMPTTSTTTSSKSTTITTTRTTVPTTSITMTTTSTAMPSTTTAMPTTTTAAQTDMPINEVVCGAKEESKVGNVAAHASSPNAGNMLFIPTILKVFVIIIWIYVL